MPLVRVPRTLPRILAPGEVDRLVAALRTARDRTMIAAMVLVGLRRCEVLGLRFEDVQIADRRLVIVAGKGGHHRVVPAANAVADRVFVVLKGPRRGKPLSGDRLPAVRR